MHHAIETWGQGSNGLAIIVQGSGVEHQPQTQHEVESEAQAVRVEVRVEAEVRVEVGSGSALPPCRDTATGSV